jgi:hypothetical protein
MKGLFLALFCLAAASNKLGAADSPAMKTYIHMKQDADIFLGEGMAEQKDFAGSPAKALEAAHARAKGALAEAIKVRVSSQTTEDLQSKDGKVSEDIKSRTQSQADVSIENIKFMEFTDFPEPGQMTVLATVDKEDYRRQLAGKAVRVYHLESGLRIGGGIRQSAGLGKLTIGYQEVGDALAAGNLDFLWRNYFAGFQVGYLAADKSSPAGSTSGGVASTRFNSSISYYGLRTGYDWAPWSGRVQPFIPVQLGYGFWDMNPWFAQTVDAAAGLGLRYWANDSIAFQLHASYHQNIWGGAITDSGGKEFPRMTADPGAVVSVSGTGIDFGLGIIWSGF